MKLKLGGYFLGPMLHDPIFLKKIRVALESRILIWVPHLLTIPGVETYETNHIISVIILFQSSFSSDKNVMLFKSKIWGKMQVKLFDIFIQH